MALKFTSDELVEIGRRVQDARIAKRMTQEYVAVSVYSAFTRTWLITMMPRS